MEHFIDSLSKQLAKTTSRRGMLSLSSRTLFASFVASTGIGRLWGSSTTTLSSSQVCPSCGTCQQCNTQAGKCGQDCENPCTAAVLCSLAQQFPPYLTLQSFLAAQFTSASVPEALVLVEPSVAQSKVLSTAYTGADPSVTANLYFTETSSGFNAYAVTYSNGAPQFGYFIAANGQLQQALPPYQLSTAAAVTSTPTGVAEASLQTNISRAAEGCQTLCEIACAEAVVQFTRCLELVTADCALSGPAYLECALVGGALCLAGSAATCGILCSVFTAFKGVQANSQTTATFQTGSTCPFQPGQPCGPLRCGTCQTCSNGACMPITCPSGYSCSSATGTCSCNNFCGGMCCPAGATCCGTTCCAPTGLCIDGICTTNSCGPGTIRCGTTCCSTATQACSNGTCVPSTCGSCTTGSFCGCGGVGGTAICCPSGDFCVDPIQALCCGNDNTVCCGGICCPQGFSCCCNIYGNSICCPPGGICEPIQGGGMACNL